MDIGSLNGQKGVCRTCGQRGHWAAEDGKGQGNKCKSGKGKSDDGKGKGKGGKWQARKAFEGYCHHCWKLFSSSGFNRPAGRKMRARTLLSFTVPNAAMELGACVSHQLAVIACSRHRPRWHTSPRSQADLTVRPFSWASMFHLVSIFPRVLEYAVCLFLTPFVFPVARCFVVK